jgi:hypothetical protein
MKCFSILLTVARYLTSYGSFGELLFDMPHNHLGIRLDYTSADAKCS